MILILQRISWNTTGTSRSTILDRLAQSPPLWRTELNSALRRYAISAAQTALLVVDLDGFKQINDTLGMSAISCLCAWPSCSQGA